MFSIRLCSMSIAMSRRRLLSTATQEGSVLEETLRQKPEIMIRKTVKQVAQRAVCTQLLLTRWGVEASLYTLPLKKGIEATEMEEERDRIVAMNASLAIAIERVDTDTFTQREKELLEKEVGKWHPTTDIGSVQPRWESLAILLWGLRIFKTLAPYTDNVDEKLLFESTAIIPAFPDTIGTFMEYFDEGEGSKEGHFITDSEMANQVNVAEV